MLAYCIEVESETVGSILVLIDLTGLSKLMMRELSLCFACVVNALSCRRSFSSDPLSRRDLPLFLGEFSRLF